AGSKFQYDESGGTFFYFLLSFLALVVIPCTYYFWPKDRKKEDNKRDRKQCHCEQCAQKEHYLRNREPLRKVKRRVIRLGTYLSRQAHADVSPCRLGSSTAEIKKAYRRLSLVYHPDKETGDERKFLKIAKAYAALTDEEARKNWETYGNPDGPGAMSFGIALPSWIVEKENSFLVLGLYALVFMIALPVAVGVWWYRSVKYGGDQVLLDTTQLYYYFIHKTPHMPLKRVLMVLASSLEFERNHNSEVVERPSDNEEVPHLMKLLPNLGEKNKERPLCFTYSIKARALLHAHLSRMNLPPNSLDIDKLYVVWKCPYLLQEFVQCVSQLTMLALAGRIARTPSLDTLEYTMKLSALVVQALWDSKNSLLQLPHVSEDMLRHFTTRKRNVRNIRQLAGMKSDERRSMLRSLSDEQYENVMNVISKMPLLEIDVRSEVLDDEDAGIITAGAIVTVTVSLCRQNMSVLFDKEFIEEKSCIDNEEDNEEKENLAIGESGDKGQTNDANVKKPKAWEKQTKGKKKGQKNAKTKKTPKTAAIKKMTQNQNQQKENTTEANSQVVAVKKTKAPKESDGESDEEGSERGSDDNSDSDVEELEQKVKANEDVSEHEEDDNWDDFQTNVSKKKEPLEGKSKLSHSVHCPYFPEDKQEYWWIYLSDKKRHALISAPYLMTNLVDKEEVELKFTAPQKPGQYTYSVIVRSDSYVDFDISKTIKLDVKEAPKQTESHPQWDISEDEEEVNKDEDSAVEDSDLVNSTDESDDELDD
ncbi:unnamed protein product, partial [Medioppia subpectinata]